MKIVVRSVALASRVLAGMALNLRKLLVAMVAMVSAMTAQAVPPTQVVYPGDDFRYAEYIDVLRRALDETTPDFGPYAMKPASVAMNELRFLREARSGRLVNVVWSATSIDKEKTLRAIRIPLGKGILGYRAFFIHEGTQAEFENIRSVEDLRRFRFCLGRGWGDVPIYQHAGFNVELAEYDGLFRMVEAGHCDAFSRGINEIFEESRLRLRALPHVAIERTLLLHYRYPFYFFVSPGEEALARRIETGLRRMLDNGAFDEIFSAHNADAIRGADFDHRFVIELENPGLPPQTPVGDSRLWFDPRSPKALAPSVSKH